MSVIATIGVPAEEFVLGAALAVDPDIRVRFERAVPVGENVVPYLWVSDHHVEDIEAALRSETGIESFRVVDTAGDRVLVRVTWGDSVSGFVDTVAQARGSVLDGVGDADGWRFDIRFDDHEGLTAFYRECRERDIPVGLERVHDQGVSDGTGVATGLTDPQWEALRLARDRGYFEVPRRTSLVELAEELGVSDTAVSQRLRRGIDALLGGLPIDPKDIPDGGGDRAEDR